jgi:hypothetical protein
MQRQFRTEIVQLDAATWYWKLYEVRNHEEVRINGGIGTSWESCLRQSRSKIRFDPELVRKELEWLLML